jgi:hypothetical protein
MNRVVLGVLILLGGFNLAVTPTVVAAQPAVAAFTPEEEQEIAALVALITETIGLVAPGSAATDYEAQLAVAIDQADKPCPLVLEALKRVAVTDIPKNALTAVKSLQAIFQRCALGTGAVDSPFGTGSSFGIGGGGSSDYLP